MYIVYDNSTGSVQKSNSIRDFNIYYNIKDGESGNSVDYEFSNGDIRYNPDNPVAIKYNTAIDKKINLRGLIVEYNGHSYKGDDVSASRMLSNLVTMSDEEAIQWKTASSEVITLSKSDLSSILKIINNQKTEIITSNLENGS